MASAPASAPSVTSSCATTCFDGNTEPRYEELRADRKAISNQVSALVNGKKKFAGVSKQRVMEDDYPIELFDEAQEIDTVRLNIAHNLRNWVEKAHDNLDVNNDVDRRFLKNMADYVQRCRRYIIANPFIVDDSEEMEIQARDVPTNDQVQGVT